MNECKEAVKKYFDPKSPSYKRKIYWQWIESNFPKKEIEKAIKITEDLRKHKFTQMVKAKATRGERLNEDLIGVLAELRKKDYKRKR